jgi:hypothetical protein
MRRIESSCRRSIARVFILPTVALLVLSWIADHPTRADEPGPLKVGLEVSRGPYYVGQGIDVAVAVVAGDKRPTLELPRPPHADLWVVDTSFKPVSATGIGAVISGANVFVTHLRLVARQGGTLELPPTLARIDGRTGRSVATRLRIEPVPLEGRPASFLGGVGEFSIRASASPASVAVGQEIQYRLEIKGPAAWGSTSRPDIDRASRLSIAPQVEPLTDELIQEPPSRTFLWRLRPTRPGAVVLPPVPISAFDPTTRRYVTKASQGTQVKVVSVPLLDPKAVEFGLTRNQRRGPSWGWAAVLLAVLGCAIGWLIARLRGSTSGSGRTAAARYAKAAATRWNGARVQLAMEETEGALARMIVADLVEYARIAVRRPAGALTPDEARSTVWQATATKELGDQAAALCERCDCVLFSQRPAEGCEALRSDARRLFSALGQADASAMNPMLSAWTSRTSD